jgi:oligopeptidase B
LTFDSNQIKGQTPNHTMRINRKHLVFFLAVFIAACKNDKPHKIENLNPPTLAKVDKFFEEYGQKRPDEYFSLNESKDSNVIRHLNAENEYTEKSLKHTEGLQKVLFTEMSNRVEQKAQSVPVKNNDYWYYTRYDEGKEYPYICRKKGSVDSPEEVLFDVPKMAEGHKIFRLFQYSVSPNNKMIAYLVDTSGDRRNSLYIKDLVSGRLLNDMTSDVAYGGLEWSNDGTNLFYLLNDPTVRAYKAMKHVVGSPMSQDNLIYEEKDNTFGINLSKTKSKKFIFIQSFSTTTSETRFMGSNGNTPLQVLQPRTRDLIYYANHFDTDEFYIFNNDKGAKNFKISTTPLSKTSISNWTDLIPHSDSALLTDFTVLKDYIITESKIRGLGKIRVYNRAAQYQHEVDFGEETYVASMSLGDKDNFAADSIRFNYESLTTPTSTYHYDIKNKVKTIIKQDKITGFNVSLYETKRIWVKSRDGVQVPVSIVYGKKSFKRDGSNPLLLYAYGSYGNSTEPYFDQNIISLLDRGFVYAIAHIRGGQELGRQWYEDGKLLKKKNTYNDFVDCADYLVHEKYTNNDRLFANGGSAGGMLMGAVINQNPGMWRGVIAEVPWTDVITDMFNDKLPLTTLEYDEWGNPNDKTYYDYMLSWSPYDNVKKANYPAILATGGLNDTQVPFVSPAKWVLRVRENNTGKNPIYFKCNMDAGHGGQSGRFDRFKLTALKYAFMLDCLGRYE